jgi:hypothetical protein
MPTISDERKTMGHGIAKHATVLQKLNTIIPNVMLVVIGTAYRVKKDFRPKTTSKNYVIRRFYFLFSVCLYNLWELVNVILALIDKIDPKTPVIAAKLFGTLLYRMFVEISYSKKGKRFLIQDRRSLLVSNIPINNIYRWVDSIPKNCGILSQLVELKYIIKKYGKNFDPRI